MEPREKILKRCDNAIAEIENSQRPIERKEQGGEHMDKEKKELAMHTAESFTKKTEIEKAFILGYMVKRMQLSELEKGFAKEPEMIMNRGRR